MTPALKMMDHTELESLWESVPNASYLSAFWEGGIQDFYEALSWSRATGKYSSTLKLRRFQRRWETREATELERKMNTERFIMQ